MGRAPLQILHTSMGAKIPNGESPRGSPFDKSPPSNRTEYADKLLPKALLSLYMTLSLSQFDSNKEYHIGKHEAPP